MGDPSHQATAVKFDEYGMFSGLEIFGHQDADVNGLAFDLFVGSTVDSKAFESGLGCGIVQWCHGTTIRR